MFLDLLNEPVARGHQGLDDYEGDDAADGEIDNQHYPIRQRKKEVKNTLTQTNFIEKMIRIERKRKIERTKNDNITYPVR
jgi:hypothetical protein